MYYFSSIFAAIGCLIMCVLATRKDAKILGKKSLLETGQLPVKQVELEEKTGGENTEASIESSKDLGTTSDKSNVIGVQINTEQVAPVTPVAVTNTEMSTGISSAPVSI